MPNSRKGRIWLSDREVDDGCDIIGDNLSLKKDHVSSVKETENHSSAQKSRIDHFNQIKEFIKWIKTNYPDYCKKGVTKLTKSKKDDEEFYCKSTHDLVCTGFNVKIFKSFLAVKKWKTKKDRTKVRFSFVHMRKYKDAILHGAKRAKKALPSSFYMEIEVFLSACEKEKK